MDRVRDLLEKAGYTVDPDKVFGGGVYTALSLGMSAIRVHPLALAAFVWGVDPKDPRLYGKAWLPVLRSVDRLGMLPPDVQQRFSLAEVGARWEWVPGSKARL